jgi:hypothetical protein
MRTPLPLILPIVVLAALVLPLVIIGYSSDQTGFAEYTDPSGDVHPAKTLWDWTELLAVPLVLVLVTLSFNWMQSENKREIATDQMQEQAIQAYFQRMSELLLNSDLQLSEESDQVRNIARVWTLTVLRRLDGKRKGILLQFLFESGLIKRGEHIPDDPSEGIGRRKAVVRLNGADLSGADLRDALMISTDLIGVNLKRSNMRRIRLSQAVLFEAKLHRACLRNANLRGADLRQADFTKADLRRADLTGALQDGTDFAGAKLRGAVGIGESVLAPPASPCWS